MSDPSILKLPELIRQFFCQRLCAERHLSSATVASYRDSFCLLWSLPPSRPDGRTPKCNWRIWERP